MINLFSYFILLMLTNHFSFHVNLIPNIILLTNQIGIRYKSSSPIPFGTIDWLSHDNLTLCQDIQIFLDGPKTRLNKIIGPTEQYSCPIVFRNFAEIQIASSQINTQQQGFPSGHLVKNQIATKRINPQQRRLTFRNFAEIQIATCRINTQ